MTEDILIHHGTKGQKWGERRYQYEDGSLTPEGRRHYGIGPARNLAEKIDNFRKKRFEAKVERAVLKRKEAEEKQRKKDAENSDKLKAAQRKRQIEEENLAAANTKAAARSSRLQSIKDSVKSIFSGYTSPEEAQAKFERDTIRNQQKLQKMELRNQEKALREQRKLEKARVKAEILRIKEERAKRKKQEAEDSERKRIENTVNSMHFNSAAELYANRSRLTDAEFNAAKARLESETRVKQLAMQDARDAAAAKAQKTAWIRSVGQGALNVGVGTAKMAIEKPAVMASTAAGVYTIAKSMGKTNEKTDAIFKNIYSIFDTMAKVKGKYEPKKDKKPKDSTENKE